jgi:tRNA wybutosine-synthesizing protein 2
VESRCTVYPGDNRVLCPQGIADRVNLGLLPTAEISYKTACLALKPKTGGILHIHGNVRTEKNMELVEHFSNIFDRSDFRCENLSWRSWCNVTANTLSNIFQEICSNSEVVKVWAFELIHLERVKSFSPHVDHLVLDIKCIPN